MHTNWNKSPNEAFSFADKKREKKETRSSEKLHPLEPLVQKLLTLFNRIAGEILFPRRSINHFKLYLNSLLNPRGIEPLKIKWTFDQYGSVIAA